MSYLVSEKDVCINDKTMKVAILELLPHGTKFEKEVTILEELEHCFRLDSADSRLNVFYCSGDSRKEATFEFVGSLDRLGSGVNGRMNIARTNDAVITRSLSFCEVCFEKESSASTACLFFFFRLQEWKDGLVNVDVKSVISCNCYKSRRKAVSDEKEIGYTLANTWSVDIDRSPDVSNDRVMIEFKTKTEDLSVKQVLKFKGPSVVRILERKHIDSTSKNFAFEMTKDEKAKVIAVCTYHKGQEETNSNTLEFIVPADPPPLTHSGNLLSKNALMWILTILLFAEPPNEVDKKLLLAVAQLVRSQWQTLLCHLELDMKEISDYKQNFDSNFVRAMAVLDGWVTKCGAAATKEVLINACRKMDISEKLIETVCKENA